MSDVQIAEDNISVWVPSISFPLPELGMETVYSYGFEDYSATEHAEEVLYSIDYESPTPSGWYDGDSTTYARSGTHSRAYPGLGTSGGGLISGVVAGFTVGETYAISTWWRAGSGTINSAGVSLYSGGTVLSSSPATSVAATWKQSTLLFTVTDAAVVRFSFGYARGSGADLYVDDVTVTRPAYTEVHNNGLDGWNAGDNVTTARTGSRGLALSAAQTSRKTFTGLMVGRPYTVSGWFRRAVSNSTGSIGVTGKSSASVLSVSATWAQVSYTFTATAPSHEVYLTSTTASFWDDVALVADPHTPTIPLPLKVKSWDLELSEDRTPYGELTLTVDTPDETYLEQLDPRDGLRLGVALGKDFVVPSTNPPQTRTFDLFLHNRTVDAKTGEMTIVGRTDEAVLIDSMLGGTTVDASAEAHQSSLRAIIDNFLDAYGTSLEAGTADADFTITSNRTNLAMNPRAISSPGVWAGSNSTISRLSGLTIPGLPGVTTAVRATASVTSSGGLYLAGDTTSPYISVTAGKTYRVTGWFRSNQTRTFSPSIQWSGAATSTLSSVSLTANVWTKLSYTVTAPVGATRMGPFWYIPGWTVSNTLDATGLTITEGTDEVDFFDGSTTDSYYTYAWTGTPNLSSATRTRLDNRSPDLLKWKPGVKAWDFISPLLGVSGLRLYCDEQRRWFLVETPHDIEGEIRVAEAINAVEAADTIDLGESDHGFGFADVVVLEYRWTDALGVPQVAYDSAGTSKGIGYHRVIERPYPGPGYAANLLQRAQGRGRTLALSVLSNYNTSPGMTIVATLPGLPIQLGRVASVRWSSEDVMEIGSRGLADTPVNAWAFAEGAWTAATGNWAAANGTN